MPTDLLLALFLCGPTLVERVLAVAGGRPVLLSETKAVAEVRGVRPEAALELLLDETLMYEQTLRTSQAAVSPAEVETAREELCAKRPELRTRVSRGDLTRLLRRQMAILRYVDFRFRPQVRPTDGEMQEAYAAEYGGRPDAPPFESVAESLRDRIVRRQVDQKVEAWVKDLRAAAEIRYVSP